MTVYHDPEKQPKDEDTVEVPSDEEKSWAGLWPADAGAGEPEEWPF